MLQTRRIMRLGDGDRLAQESDEVETGDRRAPLGSAPETLWPSAGCPLDLIWGLIWRPRPPCFDSTTRSLPCADPATVPQPNTPTRHTWTTATERTLRWPPCFASA